MASWPPTYMADPASSPRWPPPPPLLFAPARGAVSAVARSGEERPLALAPRRHSASPLPFPATSMAVLPSGPLVQLGTPPASPLCSARGVLSALPPFGLGSAWPARWSSDSPTMVRAPSAPLLRTEVRSDSAAPAATPLAAASPSALAFATSMARAEAAVPSAGPPPAAPDMATPASSFAAAPCLGRAEAAFSRRALASRSSVGSRRSSLRTSRGSSSAGTTAWSD